jgi:hypothetical protein
MTWFVRIFDQVRNWVHERLVPPYKTQFVEEDVSQPLDQKTLYIFKEDGYLWHASMLCPCGCGDVPYMNLIADEHLYWRLTEDRNGTVSLSPSVRRKRNCRCHFWFRNGRVHWCMEW